jgi:hypothetical protein
MAGGATGSAGADSVGGGAEAVSTGTETGGVGAGGTVTTAAGAGAFSTAGVSTAGATGAVFGVFLVGGGSLASFSLRRLSTGASTVEEAERTNSPMSFSMLRTVLLSTPSSFASS